jgi:DNA-binding LacI/PurR family transcriptional regulator
VLQPRPSPTEPTVPLYAVLLLYGGLALKPMSQNKVRLKDVARSAGVSRTTAWRVANGIGRVSPQIAESVRKAAEKLQVDLHQKSRTNLVAFLLGNRNLLHPFHSRILSGVECYCAQRGYHVVFLSLHYSLQAEWKEVSVPKILRRRDFVDGFILAGVHAQNLLDILAHCELPFAVQGNSVLAGVYKIQAALRVGPLRLSATAPPHPSEK